MPSTTILKRSKKNAWRRGSESNRRIKVLQTLALPLGYRAIPGGAIRTIPRPPPGSQFPPRLRPRPQRRQAPLPRPHPNRYIDGRTALPCASLPCFFSPRSAPHNPCPSSSLPISATTSTTPSPSPCSTPSSPAARRTSSPSPSPRTTASPLPSSTSSTPSTAAPESRSAPFATARRPKTAP